MRRRHAVRGIRSGASPHQAAKEGVGGEEDLWDICWILITPSLQTCVRDGEGAGAAGSRPDRECRPGGEIVEWEEGTTGVRLRFHPSTQPTEVRTRFHLILMTPLQCPGSPHGVQEGGGISAVVPHAAKLGII